VIERRKQLQWMLQTSLHRMGFSDSADCHWAFPA
jgi:hypothetical protein